MVRTDIPVDSYVEAEELNEGRVFTKAEEVSEVPRIILGRVNSGELSATVYVAIDTPSDVGELSNKVHGVLEGGSPVVLLGNALLIRLGKGRVMVELMKGQRVLWRGDIPETDSSDSQAKLAHGVEGGRASIKDLFNKFGNGSTSCPVLGELVNLLLGGYFTSDQEPEETLGKGLFTAGGLGKLLLDVGNGLATETDTLLCEREMT